MKKKTYNIIQDSGFKIQDAGLKKFSILNFEYSILKSREAGGFTLLELIIAITILTMITLIIGSGFRLGIQAWEKGEKATGEAQRLRVLSSLFSQQIASIYPYRMKLEDEDEPVVVFKGEPDSMVFVTTLANSSFGGFKWVKYIYRDGDLLYKEGLLPDKKLEEHIKKDEEIIDPGIGEVTFAYRDVEGDWEDEWDYGKELPAAVRVELPDRQPFVIAVPMGKEKKEELEPNEPVGKVL
ncbi:MAG: prepilin-type N-terminal cleavage/methylation domain-containing protein [Nitrospirae bacterium]|nr:prepilin-type N-terminal cleavage/methylation domain-containing protein [Nitrospirota bacterium]